MLSQRSAANLKSMKTEQFKNIMISLFGSSLLILITPLASAATELARINNTVITLEDFNKKYQENLMYFQSKSPTKKGVLEDIIKRELALQEAKKMGLDKDPDVVDRMNTILYHAVLNKKLGSEFEKIQVSDSDAKSFYNQNPEIRTSHIFVNLRAGAPATETQKANDKIKNIEKELRKGNMSFAEIAQKFSEGVAAPTGGDIDWHTHNELDPTYYQTALKLSVNGSPSAIVRTQFGLHIIKLTGKRSWDDTDQAKIKRLLIDERKNQIFEKYVGGLKNQAKVVVHSELLKD